MSNPDGGVSNNPAENKHPLPDCCGGLGNVDYSKVKLKTLEHEIVTDNTEMVTVKMLRKAKSYLSLGIMSPYAR